MLQKVKTLNSQSFNKKTNKGVWLVELYVGRTHSSGSPWR